MTSDFTNWQHWMVGALVALGALVLLYRLIGSLRTRQQQKRRIGAARVRSGHAPLDIPTTHGDLQGDTADPGTNWSALGHGEGQALVVDEHPTLLIHYLDPYGKLVERRIEVEQLDLHSQAIVARGNSLHDPRTYPLERITQVRDARSGQAFNLGRWVEAVRLAQRRREVQTGNAPLTER